MSIIRGALGLLAAGTAVAGYKVARNALHQDEPLVAAAAAVIGSVAASRAAHNLSDELGEVRRRSRGGNPSR